MNLPVSFDLLDCHNGGQIGVMTLNKPEALNALNLHMVNLMLVQLEAWQSNEKIVMVVIDSCTDKAFCAGGDVVSMHSAMIEKTATPRFLHTDDTGMIPEMLSQFFSQEYRLDFLIHTYLKPILVWGNGIIMGGGLGLMAGASHRVVTESSRVAMPEVSIGLYPDVGGSWFLNQMPEGCGRFLGMTGTNIDASDALFVGLADHKIAHQKKPHLFERLRNEPWQSCAGKNATTLTRICQSLTMPDTVGEVENHYPLIMELNKHSDVSDYVSGLVQLDAEQDKWLQKAQKGVTYGSPITLHLVDEQLKKGRSLSLSECFVMELIMSCRCATFGEFQEGVRALLIDKDRSPSWCFSSVENVDASTIATFFRSPWESHAHPLTDLGAS